MNPYKAGLLAGVLILALGFGLGSAGVDPLSAWLGTAGMVVAFLTAVAWAVSRVRARRTS